MDPNKETEQAKFGENEVFGNYGTRREISQNYREEMISKRTEIGKMDETFCIYLYMT